MVDLLIESNYWAEKEKAELFQAGMSSARSSKKPFGSI